MKRNSVHFFYSSFSQRERKRGKVRDVPKSTWKVHFMEQSRTQKGMQIVLIPLYHISMNMQYWPLLWSDYIKIYIVKLWCCALFCLAFLVHMLCGYCMGWMCHFSCGVNVIVTNFVIKWIETCWKLILSAWHLIRCRPLIWLITYNVVSCTITKVRL